LEGTSRHWHWWNFHFQSVARGRDVPFVTALLNALLAIDAAMPGYAARTAKAIASLGGGDHHRPDYEQLLQRLAEIHVALHAVKGRWPDDTTFVDEPVAPASGLNPEFVVSTPSVRVGVEVKAPALLEHQQKRATRPLEAGGRLFPPDKLAEVAGGMDKLTLPRDNPVKDFLISADAKFASFHAADKKFFGLLVIAWDDFIYEPITYLTHPGSGLLTSESFAEDAAGAQLTFPNVDGIVVLSHLQYFKWALEEDGQGHPFGLSSDVFKWDIDPVRPAVYIDTPHGRAVPGCIWSALDTRPLGDVPGAEYQPSDLVTWSNTA
jgi:hypothetical protein